MLAYWHSLVDGIQQLSFVDGIQQLSFVDGIQQLSFRHIAPLANMIT